jgi:hypothetical protein
MIERAHLELRGIQRFVFGGGTLLDVLGRSVIVRRLTAPAAIRRHLPDGVELVRRSAGSFSISGDRSALREAIASFTRAVADTADDLVAVAVIDDGRTAPGVQLLRARRRGGPSGPGDALLGTLRCSFSDRAAEVMLRRPGSTRPVPVSADVRTARADGRTAIGSTRRPGLGLTTDIDLIAPQLGASTKIAVLCVDVNKLGSLLRDTEQALIGRSMVPSKIDQTMLALADAFDALIDELSTYLVDFVGDRVLLTDDDACVKGDGPESLTLPLAAMTDGSGYALPIRPLIAGGDDLAVLCESRLAWSLADACFSFFDTAPEGSARERARALLGESRASTSAAALTVSVGIAVVPSGYSVQAAHAIAEGALHEAKQAGSGEAAAQTHRIAWRFGPATPDEASPRPTGSGGVYTRRSPWATTADEIVGLSWLARGPRSAGAGRPPLPRVSERLRAVDRPTILAQVPPPGPARFRTRGCPGGS